MDNEEIEKVIREYIEQVVHLSLATVASDKPWVSEVHFAYDNGLNLYFLSEKSRRHSQDIENNPQVAGSIVTQHHKHQKVRGVYFEGTAKRLSGVTAEHPAYQAYVARLGGWPTILQEIADEAKAALYEIRVDTFALFDGYNGNGKLELSWRR